MQCLKKISADVVAVMPALIEGMEKHGYCYFMWETADTVGAQCAKCHNIVWQSSLNNKTLCEVKPANLPDSGKQYTDYYQQKISRFLVSQPDCPECGSNHYDLFVNNVNFPRYADGTLFNEGLNIALRELPDAPIWWLG